MDDTRKSQLRLQRRLKVPAERVFDAWLDPNVNRLWLFTSPTSEAHEVEIDARVGGRWQITDQRDGVIYRALGEYLEIDRPRKIVFTFGMPQFSEEFARVTVQIEPDGAGSLLVVTHERLPWSANDEVEQGWNAMFDRLSQQLDQLGDCC